MGDDDDETSPIIIRKIVVRTVVVGVLAVAATTRLAARRPARRTALSPFTQRYDGHVLTSSQLEALDAGQRVLMSARSTTQGGGRGSAVCDVAAPPGVVWKTILGFDRYPGRLAQCKAAQVYERRKYQMRGETIKVKMTLDGILKDFHCYYDHVYRPDKSELTWTLDKDRKSDFLDVQGQWCVDKHPSKPDWTRVWYSADVALPPWLPTFVVVRLCKTSGNKALAFCKTESERAYLQEDGGAKRWRLPPLRGGVIKGH